MMSNPIKQPDKKQEAKDCKENNKQLIVAKREIKQMLKDKR